MLDLDRVPGTADFSEGWTCKYSPELGTFLRNNIRKKTPEAVGAKLLRRLLENRGIDVNLWMESVQTPPSAEATPTRYGFMLPAD
jgi:hypothetical protein